MYRLLAAVLVAGWRTSLISLALIPVTLCWLTLIGVEPQQRPFLRDPRMWADIVKCGAYLSCGGCGYNAAIAYTTIAQAVMFTNLQPLLIIGWRLLMARPVSRGEGVGTLLGAAGMTVVVNGAHGTRSRFSTADAQPVSSRPLRVPDLTRQCYGRAVLGMTAGLDSICDVDVEDGGGECLLIDDPP